MLGGGGGRWYRVNITSVEIFAVVFFLQLENETDEKLLAMELQIILINTSFFSTV